jgi:hypothetical protein
MHRTSVTTSFACLMELAATVTAELRPFFRRA